MIVVTCYKTHKYLRTGYCTWDTLMVPIWSRDLHYNEIRIFLLFMLSQTVFACNIYGIYGQTQSRIFARRLIYNK